MKEREGVDVFTPYSNGLDSIPEEWLKKYNKSEEVIGYIETVMSI